MAAVRGGQAEGKRVLALLCEAGRREALWQRRGQERRLSSSQVHSLVAVKILVGSEIKLFLEVLSSCAQSFYLPWTLVSKGLLSRLAGEVCDSTVSICW